MSRRIAISAAVAAALLVAAPRPVAAAGTASSTLTVKAKVLGVCTISTNTFDFADYNPASATPLDVTGAIALKCTNGTTFRVELGTGANHDGTTRQMKGGPSAELLKYELYTDSARQSVWTAGESKSANVAGAGLGDYSIPVYGRVAALQNVSTGDYSDSVTMTVNF